jgi:hypothetical protein
MGLQVGQPTRDRQLVPRLGQLMLEEYHVLRQGPPLPQPDPRLGDIGTRREGTPLVPDDVPAVVVDGQQMLLVHEQVLLDLTDLLLGEPDRPIRPHRPAQVRRDVRDIARHVSEEGIGTLSPGILRRHVQHVTGTDLATGLQVVAASRPGSRPTEDRPIP